ncbi:MAG: methylated-DNA--[protein]-cysteine S-methyltransferase [Blastocatellia bacterium]|nr:methylated-DNA--[protein]-cysteine S-methyltransferase [Blastocatellia bacterium]
MIARPLEKLLLDRLKTPIGEALIVFDDEGRLRALDWEDYEPRMLRLLHHHYGNSVMLEAGPGPLSVIHALEAYFAGELGTIEKISCRSEGTPFQQSVWAALRTIPAGKTLSYSSLAARIGKPAAVRAVGNANGANPISVVVPCHRVIGASGALTGYGGGIERKRWLLRHEAGSI